MTSTVDYTVHLDNFEGPLDLLLYLIRKAEVEITAIPIATIADQYIRHLEAVPDIDVDVAGEFLVMAATLMEMKSRTLSPPEEGEEGEASDPIDTLASTLDPRSELVQQLLAFKWCRDAAEALEARRDEWRKRFPAGHGGVDRDALQDAAAQMADTEVEDLELFDLVEAFSQIVASVDFSRLGEHHIALDETPIEEHMAIVLDDLRAIPPNEEGRRETPFREIFRGRNRSELVGLFLAILELVRQQQVRVWQGDPANEIVLRLCEDSADAAPQEIADAVVDPGSPDEQASNIGDH